MDELRFDGRVAVVTGAGRGIGRAYAELLAARGASVVVNDLGSTMSGEGADVAPADGVVSAIVAAGGTAVADGHDVSDEAGAAALIDVALSAFGRIDILVNNAGIMRWGAMPDVSDADLDRHLAVHVKGSFHTARAAWPHMAEQGHGRIVMTTSAGVFGLHNNLSYATAKGAVIGMTRSLSLAGARHGIVANLIAPAAVTRMAGSGEVEPDTTGSPMAPEYVAPLVAYLAHESCPVSGEIYAAGGGRFSRILLASTPGYLHGGSEAATIEDVAANWATINDETGYHLPDDLMDWSTTFMAHLADGA